MMAAAKPAAWDQGTDPWYCWECCNTGSGPNAGEWDSTPEENEEGCHCCGEAYGRSHEYDAEIPPCFPKTVRDKWYATHEKVDYGDGYVQWIPKEASR
jgi:hypothetical protein